MTKPIVVLNNDTTICIECYEPAEAEIEDATHTPFAWVESGECARCGATFLPQGEHKRRIAQALADWSSTQPWDARHSRNQTHWLLAAEALMSNEARITDPILVYINEQKDSYRVNAR